MLPDRHIYLKKSAICLLFIKFQTEKNVSYNINEWTNKDLGNYLYSHSKVVYERGT